MTVRRPSHQQSITLALGSNSGAGTSARHAVAGRKPPVRQRALSRRFGGAGSTPQIVTCRDDFLYSYVDLLPLLQLGRRSDTKPASGCPQSVPVIDLGSIGIAFVSPSTISNARARAPYEGRAMSHVETDTGNEISVSELLFDVTARGSHVSWSLLEPGP